MAHFACSFSPFAGLLAKQTYGNGNFIDFTYDNLDRLTERKYNGSSTNRATYLYGANGSLAQTMDYSVGTRTQFTYDFANRLVSQQEYATTARNGGALRSSTDYTYADKTNYLTGIKHFSPLGTQTIGYTYGDINKGEMPDQVYKVSWNGKEKVSNHYDALGRLTGKFIFTDGPTLTYAYGYEDIGENQTSTSVSRIRTPFGLYRYSYDAVGNITSVSFGTKYTNTYEYDALNQLVRENNQQIGKTYTYAYQNGNITERKEYAYTTGELGEVLETKTWSYSNNTWGDLLTNFNGQTITYDEIGNPLTIGSQTLSWNGRQLQSITDGENTYSYAYNIDGQRVSKTVNGVTTEFFYNREILAGQKTGEDTLVFMYDNSGDAFGFAYNGTEYYYLKNKQGDVDAVVDSNRQIVAKYAYDAWGKVISVTDADGVEITDNTHIGHINPIRYRGYYYDQESNFYYLNSRYYAPDICRFLNADGIYDTDTGILSHNMFAYCNNNPVNMIDSEGTGPKWEAFKDKAKDIWNKVVNLFKGEPDIPEKAASTIDSYENIVHVHENVQQEMYIHAENVVNAYSGKNTRKRKKYKSFALNLVLLTRKTAYDKLTSFQGIDLEGCMNFQIEGREWDDFSPEEQQKIAENMKAWDPIGVAIIGIVYGVDVSKDIWEVANG